MKVVVAPAVRRDLVEIGTWIARDKPRAADRMVDRLLSAAKGLSRYPLRYPSAGLRGLRKRPVGGYLIFYRVDDDINVVRILNAARDWVSLLDEA